MSTQEPNIPYGGTTAERLKAFALNEAARERLGMLATRYWEIAAYGVIAVFAAVLRFYNLGARAMHHDESLHGFFSYGFTKGLREFFTPGTANNDTYKHVPFMHGPFQFIGNGFVMWIFQDGEYQARILAAAMGTGLVLMPFLFRKQLGTIGALATSTFIAVSPTLLYYSRFTREDIYTAFWTFGIVIFMWRYIATRRDLFLYLTAAFMAFAFATKETTFMTVAAFILFMDFMFALHVADKIRAKQPMDGLRYAGLVVALLPVAWAVAFAWPFLDSWRGRYELDELPPEANLIIVMGTLALPQYAAAVQFLPFFGNHGPNGVCANISWRNCAGETGDSHIASPEFRVAMVSVWGLIGLSASLGLMWRPRTWLIAAAAFWVPYVLLYTTFFTNLPGFFSGIWGSMDYWISQQDVRRGNQPDYYYFITIPVYEFVPLALSIAAAGYYAIRGRLGNALIVAGGMLLILVCLLLDAHRFDDNLFKIAPFIHDGNIAKVGVIHYWIPFTVVLIGIFAFQMDIFTRFLMFWLVITAFALTIAGEKMPWLNVHIALPLAVLAGRFVGEILGRSDLRDDLPKLERLAPFLYAAVASALSILVFVIVGPFSFASAGGWILAGVAGIAVYWAFAGYSRTTAMQVAVVGAVAAFSIFTVRASVLAAWGHPNNPYTGDVAKKDYGEVPDELLVYTQTSGDIPVLRDKVDQYAKETGLGLKTPIVVDSTDGYTWPWVWYLRRYTNVTYVTVGPNYKPPQGAILFINKSNQGNVQVGSDYGEPLYYHHRRWFPEDYRGADGKYSTHNFFSDLFLAKALKSWLDYWVRRTPPSNLGTVDGVAFFPKGFELPREPVGPTVRAEGTQLVIGGNGSAPGQLSQPSDVTFDSSGNIYVADTQNNRIQKYDAQGNFVAAAGGFTSDVTMNQPWSMAVASDGTVFVADTWDHKILKLDKDLKKAKEWGSGGQVDAGGDPMKLFGPREIVLTADGNLLVADTGNNRIIEYTQDGDFVRQFGSKGSSGDPLQFTEPVGIVTAQNGDIYIADFWNKRIVHLDKDLTSKGEIKIPTWGSTNVTDRPYMALLPDGRLLVTDPNPCPTAPQCATPSNGKVLVFDGNGNQVAAYEPPKEGKNTVERPIGIATDGTSVLVADGAGSVVRKIPLSEIVK